MQELLAVDVLFLLLLGGQAAPFFKTWPDELKIVVASSSLREGTSRIMKTLTDAVTYTNGSGRLHRLFMTCFSNSGICWWSSL
jgi:hypothetical protein